MAGSTRQALKNTKDLLETNLPEDFDVDLTSVSPKKRKKEANTETSGGMDDVIKLAKFIIVSEVSLKFCSFCDFKEQEEKERKTQGDP